MEIVADVSVRYKIDSLNTERLVLNVKFKKPNKFFKTRLERTLCSSWWIRDHYMDKNEFLNDVISWLSDKDSIVKVVENMVKKELGLTDRQIEENKKYDTINNLLQDDKFQVKIKL